MIKSFSFKNYKAFKEGKIELKPITILLGVNSVGKSSILQFLSMIKQTINIDKKRKSALKLNGENISLGENKNIFHNQKIDIPLEISFEINNFDIKKIKKEFENSIKDILMSFERIYSFSIEKEENYGISRYRRGLKEMNCFSILENIQFLKTKINEQIKDSEKEDIEEFLHMVVGPRYRINISKFYSKEEKKIILNLNHYNRTCAFLEKIQNSFKDSVLLSYQIISKNNDLQINKIEIRNNKKIILGYNYYKKDIYKFVDKISSVVYSIVPNNISRKKIHNLYSDVLNKEDLDIYKEQFGNSIFFEKLDIFSDKHEIPINLEGIIAKIKLKKIKENIFIDTVFKIFKHIINEVQNNFCLEKINHVSPLRASPKRYYFLDEANVSSSLNTVDGNQLAEILKENENIKKMANSWLKKFGLKVDIKKLADVIHNIKINQHGLNLDITDVGFGISQVLPVIVQGFLSHDDSLTIIEQPEIHLHPKMQADLADLFIDIVNTKKEHEKGKKLLIETHSGCLLKRLRRRMAENEKISANDVAIYFVHPKKNKYESGKIEKIEINKTGDFKWPKDFYGDSLEDTMEFLKYQK